MKLQLYPVFRKPLLGLQSIETDIENFCCINGRKKRLILIGGPGVGKTTIAQWLQTLVNKRTQNRVVVKIREDFDSICHHVLSNQSAHDMQEEFYRKSVYEEISITLEDALHDDIYESDETGDVLEIILIPAYGGNYPHS